MTTAMLGNDDGMIPGWRSYVENQVQSRRTRHTEIRELMELYQGYRIKCNEGSGTARRDDPPPLPTDEKYFELQRSLEQARRECDHTKALNFDLEQELERNETVREEMSSEIWRLRQEIARLMASIQNPLPCPIQTPNQTPIPPVMQDGRSSSSVGSTSRVIAPQKVKRQMEVHDADLTCLACAPYNPAILGAKKDNPKYVGALLVIGTADGFLKFTDGNTGQDFGETDLRQHLKRPNHSPCGICCVGIGDDQRSLFCGTYDGILLVLDLEFLVDKETGRVEDIVSHFRSSSQFETGETPRQPILGCGFLVDTTMSTLSNGRSTTSKNRYSSFAYCIGGRCTKFFDGHNLHCLKIIDSQAPAVGVAASSPAIRIDRSGSPMAKPGVIGFDNQQVLAISTESGHVFFVDPADRFSLLTVQIVGRQSQSNFYGPHSQTNYVLYQNPQQASRFGQQHMGRFENPLYSNNGRMAPLGCVQGLAFSPCSTSVAMQTQSRVDVYEILNNNRAKAGIPDGRSESQSAARRASSGVPSTEKTLFLCCVHTIDLTASPLRTPPTFSNDSRMLLMVHATGLQCWSVWEGKIESHIEGLQDLPKALDWHLPAVVSCHAGGMLRLWD